MLLAVVIDSSSSESHSQFQHSLRDQGGQRQGGQRGRSAKFQRSDPVLPHEYEAFIVFPVLIVHIVKLPPISRPISQTLPVSASWYGLSFRACGPHEDTRSTSRATPLIVCI
jgi:hypothetical protein